MKEDEMKLIWRELNEEMIASTLANKETLIYILKSRRKTAWQRLVIASKSYSIFLLLFATVIIYHSIFVNQGAAFVRIQAVILLVVACALNITSYLKLTKIKLDESVPVLYKKVSSYKKLTVWTYLICYVLSFTFVVSLLFVLPYFAKVLTLLMIPVGVTLDCFLFHWSSNHIHTLIDTAKELKELNKK